MVLPNLLVIGSAKSGTTTLWKRLADHPEIYMSPTKEIQFFSDDRKYEKGSGFYASFFPEWVGEPVVGEASHQYSVQVQHPQVPTRIAELLPDVKLVYIVRHPLRRIESEWLQVDHSAPSFTCSFSKDILAHPWYVDRSLYHKQIQAYLKYFPAERIHVIFFEDFVNAPLRELGSLWSFLGVDPSFVPANPHRNEKPSVKRRDTRLLRALRGTQLDAISRFLPHSFRRPLSRLLTTTNKELVEWDDAVSIAVKQRIEPDLKTFLRERGKPADFWCL